MRNSLSMLFAGAAAAGLAAGASAQMIDTSGFWVQYEGTLSACDTNPFFGGSGMPYVDREGVPMGVDLDPNYDWVIFETMVGTPVHGHPYYQWPANAPLGDVPFGTHELGYAMGVMLVWRDTNGFDPSAWGRGQFLMSVMIGMSHQENDGHSSLSWWTDWSDPDNAPWDNEFLGVAFEDGWGPWIDQYGPGWIIEGHGITTAVEEIGGHRHLDWYRWR